MSIISQKYKNYNDFINKKKFVYLKKSLSASNKVQNFVSKLTVLNNKTGELFPVKYDFMKIQRDNYLWYNFVSTYIQDNAIKEGLKAVFVTLTLDGNFHPYKTLKNGKHIYNENYVLNNNGYKILNSAFRALYNNFRINDKKIKLSFLRVIEPHKDFTPHLHGILFLKNEQIEYLRHHLDNTINRFELGKQFDFTILENTSASVSYILKYVKKTINSSEETQSRIIDGWKKDNKIRMFTSSRISVSREIYRVVSRFVPLKSDNKSYSILKNLEKRISLELSYHKIENAKKVEYKHKKLFNHKARYKVVVKKRKIEYKNTEIYTKLLVMREHWTHYTDLFNDLDAIDFNFQELHEFFYEYYLQGDLYYVAPDYDFKTFFRYMDFRDFVDLFNNYIELYCFQKRSSYKIDDFTIYDTVEKTYLYDKKDFSLL